MIKGMLTGSVLILSGIAVGMSIEASVSQQRVKHNDETTTKVHSALVASGLHPDTATEALYEMQNAGILFRELVV